MEQRIKERTVTANLTYRLKRIWIDVAILAVMFGATFLLPSTSEQAASAGPRLNLLALFITKTNSVLWGWLLVDIIRKWAWPYLDLRKLVEGKNMAGTMFILGIYIVVIYSFAVGG